MNKLYVFRSLLKLSIYICGIVIFVLILSGQNSRRRTHWVSVDGHDNADDYMANNPEKLWKFIVKRFWNLTKNQYTDPKTIHPSFLTDYFINNPAYSLWGFNSYFDTSYKRFDSNFESHSYFVEPDRIVPQLVFVMEGYNHRSFQNARTKTILLYEPKSWSHEGDFTRECPGWASKCEFFVNDNSTKNKAVDAVITTGDVFHQVPVDDGVKRFFYTIESPFTHKAELSRENDFLTAFWRGSDIALPYGKWVYYDPDVRSTKQDINYAFGRTKMAAIFVSNCKSANRRMRYVHELKKYIDVDVFGKCGLKTCRRYVQRTRQYSQEYCFKRLKKDYKFYLSFENSNCRDYITEKLFVNAFWNNVIPVVLGGKIEDYLAAVPEGSFLHVSNFTSAKALADHMTLLASNDEKYGKYFEWKGTGKFISRSYFCRVCAMLHYSDLVLPPKRRENFVWSSQALCMKWKKFLWKDLGKQKIWW